MMKSHNKVKIIILKILYSSSQSRLDSYSIFRRTRISFIEFSKHISALRTKGYIEGDSLIISLTEGGRDFLLRNYTAFQDREKSWRKVPKSMLGPKLEINYKYVPSKKLLDKKLNSDLDIE